MLLGTAVGFVPSLIVIENARRRDAALAAIGIEEPHPLSIPGWPSIIGTAVLIPLGAILIAGLMTRTRPPEPLRVGG